MDKMFCVLAGYDDQTSQHLDIMKMCLSDFESLETKDLPHHITLCSTQDEKEEDIKKAVFNVAHDIEAFPVTFNHIGIFRS